MLEDGAHRAAAGPSVRQFAPRTKGDGVQSAGDFPVRFGKRST
jgi:hypothetical protein